MHRYEVVTTQLTHQADGVVSVRLRRPDGEPLPAWTPGAHVDLVLPVGITRQYSLMGDPADPSSYVVTVLQHPNSRGGSDYVHLFLRPGQRVHVSEPRNHFALEDAPRYRFVAGGIGITPLLPMVEAVAAAGGRWALHYGGRRRSSMAFAADLLARHPGGVTLWPADERGRMPLATVLSDREPGERLYCCGPEALLAAVRDGAAEHGWPDEAVHVERFAPTVQEHGPDRALTVVAARSGREVPIEADESVLEGLERAGIGVASSCRAGICGACQTTVLEGEPDHRDDLLSAAQREEGGVMMPCVSRACGERIVLDV